MPYVYKEYYICTCYFHPLSHSLAFLTSLENTLFYESQPCFQMLIFFLSACALKCKWSKCSLCEALPHSRFLGASLNQLSTQSRLKGGAMSTPQELFHKVGTITNTCNKSVCSLRFLISLIAQGKISMILNVTKTLQGRKSIGIHTISARVL